MGKFKKILSLASALAITASLGALTVCAAPKDDVLFNGNMSNPVPEVGANMHVLGLYPPDGTTLSYTDGNLVFDTAVSGGWCTGDFGDADGVPLDKSNTPEYKYLAITIKSDNPTTAEGAHLSLGKDAEGNQLGLAFADWGINLTDTYQTVYVDLAKSGLKTWADSGSPDFALNQSDATAGKIYIKSMVLTNTKGGTTVAADATKVPAATTSKTDTKTPSTGDSFPMTVAALAVAGSLATIFVVRKNKNK